MHTWTESVDHLASLLTLVRTRFGENLENAAQACARQLAGGGRIYFMGNGGSAADAIHWAGELMGRFRFNRQAIPAYALMENPAYLTAAANDTGYDSVFARQTAALVVDGDVLVAISTSGDSPNVVTAVEAVAGRRVLKLGFTGEGGGRLGPLCDFLFDVPSHDTPRVQEVHALAGHFLCERIEALLFPGGTSRPAECF